VSWSRLTLDNFWRDPSKVRIDAYPELAGYDQGFFPGQSPYLPLNIITSGWGQGGLAICGRLRWTCSPTTMRCSSRTR
jgi:hypothetical protein